MSAELHPFPTRSIDTGDGNGSGGSMLEQRVDRLEKILVRLEPKITELLLTTAKQADVQKVQIELAELKGKLAGIEGRIAGLDGKVGALPSTYTILTIVFTTWALGSGILIFALNLLRR